MRNIGPDAKPRRPKLSVPRSFLKQHTLKASIARENAKSTGRFVQIDRAPSGAQSGLVVGTAGSSSGISVDPAVAWAYMIRQKLKPIRVADCLIYDSTGKLIAKIVTDSVTGQRTRHVV